MTESALEYREQYEHQQAQQRRDERNIGEWLRTLAILGKIRPVRRLADGTR